MKDSRGYTLIEVIVALAVFALLAVMSTSAIYHTFNTREHLAKQTDQLNTLELAITRIRRDSTQWIERNIRGNEGRVYLAVTGEPTYVEFTRTGQINPDGDALQSTLNRVAYLCVPSQLIRRTFDTLDTLNRKNYSDQILLDHLSSCSFSYISPKREKLSEWQILALQQHKGERSLLPIALELSLTMENMGPMNLLFVIPEGLYGS